MQSRDVAIRLSQITKTYRLYDNPVDRVVELLFPTSKPRHKNVNALKGITLEIYRGETVGIVGTNGAGKSTLLQIICGTLRADSGSVDVQGRISALLELGTAFNPEFTGRENIRINSLVLGLSPAELEAKFSDIIAFADIGEFVDRPIKTYSSGMVARLAFAIAIHVDPEILIIDEALAVGDEAFRRKCYARLERIKFNGATILFVSHSAGSVLELCDRAVLMNKGENLMVGEPKEVITKYQKIIYSAPAESAAIIQEIRNETALSKTQARGPVQPAPAPPPKPVAKTSQQQAVNGDFFDPELKSKSMEAYPVRGAEISNVRILTTQNKQVNVLATGGRYIYTYDVMFSAAARNVRFAMLVKSLTGVELGAQWTAFPNAGIAKVEAGKMFRISLPFSVPFNFGTYHLNAGVQGVVNDELIVMHRLIDAAVFRIPQPIASRGERYVDVTSSEPTVTEI